MAQTLVFNDIDVELTIDTSTGTNDLLVTGVEGQRVVAALRQLKIYIPTLRRIGWDIPGGGIVGRLGVWADGTPRILYLNFSDLTLPSPNFYYEFINGSWTEQEVGFLDEIKDALLAFNATHVLTSANGLSGDVVSDSLWDNLANYFPLNESSGFRYSLASSLKLSPSGTVNLLTSGGKTAGYVQLPSKPSHYWRLDEGAGVPKVDSVGTVTMTDFGSANVASSPIAKDGNALHATAHQTQALRNITVRTGLDVSVGRTWSAWIRPTVAVGTIFMRGRTGPFEPEYWVTLDTGVLGAYKITCYLYNTTGDFIQLTYDNAALVFGSYVHIFVGFDLDNKIRLAVNGVLVATSLVALSGTPRINNVDSNLYFMGSIFGPDCSTDHRQDEIATFAEQFSTERATAMYNGGAGVFWPTVGADNTLGSSSILPSGSKSIAFWVKFDSVSGVQNIFYLGSPGTTLRRQGANLRVIGSGGVSIVTGSATIAVGTWYHVVYILDDPGDLSYVYIDGVLDITAANTETDPNLNAEADLDGAIYLDDISVFSSILTAPKILSLYNFGAGRFL